MKALRNLSKSVKQHLKDKTHPHTHKQGKGIFISIVNPNNVRE